MSDSTSAPQPKPSKTPDTQPQPGKTPMPPPPSTPPGSGGSRVVDEDVRGFGWRPPTK